jgi:hypothetical protein
MKPNVNWVELHPQMNNNGHPMDGALVGAGSLWPNLLRSGKRSNKVVHMLTKSIINMI